MQKAMLEAFIAHTRLVKTVEKKKLFFRNNHKKKKFLVNVLS